MRSAWDAEAERFDDQPDHGLLDPAVRAAWVSLLSPLLPPAPARALDVGSGTGSVAVLLAELGYEVVGVDLAPLMVARAARKAQDHAVHVNFMIGDATEPPVEGPFDVVVGRHVLWAMSAPSAALECWLRLLSPTGVLVLVEGFWHTGAGLPAADLLALVTARARALTWRRLSDQPALWGGPVTDERYLITATSQ